VCLGKRNRTKEKKQKEFEFRERKSRRFALKTFRLAFFGFKFGFGDRPSMKKWIKLPIKHPYMALHKDLPKDPYAILD
ncbi:MAG: hypothetical protein Q8P93_04610, partial [bacterium]|nr:hypothetical protein [bacterium]